MWQKVALAVGLLLLLKRVVDWQQGRYTPDWVGIGSGILVGYAALHVLGKVAKAV